VSTLNVTFTNNSNVDASAVYIGFVPGSSGAEVSIVNLKDNSPIKSVYDGFKTFPSPGNWYSLNSLSSGIGINSFSGRIYVCYNKSWEPQNNGYEPAQAVTDANLFLRYDKMELTFTGDPNDVADLTSIDYWSIPMSLNTRKASEPGKVVGSVRGLLPGVTTQQVFDDLNKLTATPVSGVTGPGGTDGEPMPALVPGQYQQYPGGPAPGTTFARIIGPSSYPSVFPPPAGIPVTPYDLLQGYLTYLLNTFGPSTQSGTVPTLGAGVIANIAGEFNGVGPNVPATGPQSRQSYTLTATIDDSLNITLSGTASGVQGSTTMLYKVGDLLNPTGIYGGNAPYYLNGATTSTNPGNDVYGWIGGDLFSGLNIGAVGSKAQSSNGIVGSLSSQLWFKLPVSSFFAGLQPDNTYYNQWAATLSKLSEAYNFAYTDRFSPVLVSLNPKIVDTLEIVLEDGTVNMASQA
jgi:Beta-1,3-glucanase